jgi:Flp pilus assembly protein TadD
MEAIERRPLRISAVGTWRPDPAGIAAWLLPAVLIVYLALSNGGYGIVERSEIGIAVWWIVLIGTVVGVLPVAGGTRMGRLMLLLLGAFAAWTAFSMIWTESAERTSIEVARVATYLGVFALALAVQGEGRWRHVLNGVTTGVAVVCGIALLSRFEPTWFSTNIAGHFLPGIEIKRRLSYPINYSTGLAAFAGIALPLLLAATASARTLLGQALAAAALPVVALTMWLTSSGLAVMAAALALVVFFVLTPDRLPKLATLAVAAAGSAILFAAVEQRDALGRGLPSPAAISQGGQMEVIVVVVCVGVALLQTGIGLAVRYGTRPQWLQISRRQATRATAVAVGLALVIGLAAGLPGVVSDRWGDFKSQDGAGAADSRGAQLLSTSGSGRYQFWQSAVDANKTDPLIGIGPGTFEYWWSRNGSYTGYVRDAHSLYVETLAELGIVGLLLIGGFSIAVLAVGAARARRAPPHLRLALAAATAGCAAFAGTAMVDWTWEIGVLPCIFVVLAAIAVAAGRPAAKDPAARAGGWRRYASPAAVAALSLAALLAIALPLSGSSSVQASQDQVAKGNLDAALADARDAAGTEPFAATPYLQEALVLELQGQFEPAVAAARQATTKEPTNFQTWLVLSRLEAENGNAQAAVDAYRRAKSLHPNSGMWPA